MAAQLWKVKMANPFKDKFDMVMFVAFDVDAGKPVCERLIVVSTAVVFRGVARVVAIVVIQIDPFSKAGTSCVKLRYTKCD